jgi:hypothetical protein
MAVGDGSCGDSKCGDGRLVSLPCFVEAPSEAEGEAEGARVLILVVHDPIQIPESAKGTATI